ncbi:MAG: hypothetical protein ACR2J1_08200 [Methyloceanibacter sp.]|uniref:hypothetical protein n=1 Tax=Methyloceanibacter sp. TaxID=1965321 RepID=UPI003D9B41CF
MGDAELDADDAFFALGTVGEAGKRMIEAAAGEAQGYILSGLSIADVGSEGECRGLGTGS